MKDIRSLPIGVFDSGIGGLTVVRQMHRVMPSESIIYLGDTARVPYGTKSHRTIIRFACEDANFLMDKCVKAIVVACNTASSCSIPVLEKLCPVPVFGVILPGSIEAVKKSKTGRIGVIGTRSTIRSGAYEHAIRSVNPDVVVVSQACPLLVPLVEENWIRHPVTTEIITEYLKPVLRNKIDVLVLGCTHYPMLKNVIKRVVGPSVKLVDSALTCAKYVKAQLEKNNLLNPQKQKGTLQFYVTDEPESFNNLASKLMDGLRVNATKIDLQQLKVVD